MSSRIGFPGLGIMGSPMAANLVTGERKFIRVDIESTQLGRVFEPDLGIVSDARLFLRALLAAAKARNAGGRDPAAWASRGGGKRKTQ